MNRTLITIGILLVFIGLIVFSYSRTTVEKITTQPLGITRNKWSASCNKKNATEGDMLIINVVPEKDWYQLAEIENKYLKIKVNITDPLGNVTEFEAYYVKAFGKPTKLLPWNFSVIFNNGKLKVNENPDGTVSEIGGITKLGGNYSVEVAPIGCLKPPTTIEIFKEIKNYEQPWIFLSPIGVSLIVIGASCSVVSFKKKLRRRRFLKKKAPHKIRFLSTTIISLLQLM